MKPLPTTPAQTGVWVGIGAIMMSFAAYSSALIVRQGANPDWVHFTLPRILFFNTLVVLASSATLFLSRGYFGVRTDGFARSYSAGDRRPSWLYATFALGVVFLVGQFLAWRNLAGQGLSLASGPSSAFFYLLTGMHGLHLVGGLAALFYVVQRSRRSHPAAVASVFKAASLYWHFMTVLWLYLFVLLVSRI
jgi:cytochrome c oxidase subunit 3